jgi:hypothetical protein
MMRRTSLFFNALDSQSYRRIGFCHCLQVQWQTPSHACHKAFTKSRCEWVRAIMGLPLTPIYKSKSSTSLVPAGVFSL